MHCKEDNNVLKHCSSTREKKRLMWVGVGVGVGAGVGVDFSKPESESESESESLKFGRLRSPDTKIPMSVLHTASSKEFGSSMWLRQALKL